MVPLQLHPARREREKRPQMSRLPSKNGEYL